MYSSLDPRRIVETLARLAERIEARFADAGLARVCREVLGVAERTQAELARLQAPNWPLRCAVIAVIVLGAAAQIAAARFLLPDHVESGLDLLQNLEAAVNLLILFGGAAWFLMTLEERLARKQALAALHQLRSLAHVVDMHQLTKDPTLLLGPPRATSASPARTMSRFELTRYLDYCAELQALIGKLAALYAEGVRDPVVIEAVNDLENLATNLGRKIWQKIMILSALEENAA